MSLPKEFNVSEEDVDSFWQGNSIARRPRVDCVSNAQGARNVGGSERLARDDFKGFESSRSRNSRYVGMSRNVGIDQELLYVSPANDGPTRI
jgi:hypothetical protein